jgi:hypothetical protein
MTPPLSEILELLKANPFVATQIKQRIEQGRPMTGGKDETIPIKPPGIPGVVLQETPKKNVPDGCCS